MENANLDDQFKGKPQGICKKNEKECHTSFD